MKKVILAAMLISMLMLTACSAALSIDDIASFTKQHEALLIDCGLRGNFSDALIMPEILHAYGEIDCTVYTFGKAGILSDSRSGIYYSFDGEPAGAGYVNKWKLQQHGDGFIWKETGGDNIFYTEHLFGNFYTFEMTW